MPGVMKEYSEFGIPSRWVSSFEVSQGRRGNIISRGCWLPGRWYKVVIVIVTHEIVIEAVKEVTEGLLFGQNGTMAGRARK